MNVLFITCDQWRADSLSCSGHPVVRTPSLDRLASEGMRFARHYTQSAPCGPARASLYTGQYLMNTRAVTNGSPVSRSHPNVATELRKLGYDAVLTGYNDIGADPLGADLSDPALHSYGGPMPGISSIDANPGGSSSHLASNHTAWLASLGYEIPSELLPSDKGPAATATFASAEIPSSVKGGQANVILPGPFSVGVDDDGQPVSAFYSADHTEGGYCVSRAQEHIASKHGSPWAICLSSLRPHPPWLLPEPFNRQYPPSQCGGPHKHRMPSPAEEAALHPYMAQRLTWEMLTVPEGTTDEELALMKSQYWGSCSEADYQLGRLFDWLRERGEWDNTLGALVALRRTHPLSTHTPSPNLATRQT